jgi:hypothetical protein
MLDAERPRFFSPTKLKSRKRRSFPSMGGVFYPDSGYDFSVVFRPELAQADVFVLLDARPVFRRTPGGDLVYPFGHKMFMDAALDASVMAEEAPRSFDGESYTVWRMRDPSRPERVVSMLFIDGVDVESMPPSLKAFVAEACKTLFVRGFCLHKALSAESVSAFGFSMVIVEADVLTPEEQEYYRHSASVRVLVQPRA